MLMESVSNKTTLFENIWPSLLQNVDKVNHKYLKYYSQLKNDHILDIIKIISLSLPLYLRFIKFEQHSL